MTEVSEKDQLQITNSRLKTFQYYFLHETMDRFFAIISVIFMSFLHECYSSKFFVP